jgi:hypothetical protein
MRIGARAKRANFGLQPSRLAQFASTVVAAVIIVASAVVGAQAQITSFDGTYRGVSITSNGGFGSCVGTGRPRPLIITGGTAVWHGGPAGDVIFQGDVTPRGEMTMRDSRATILFARIDASGKISGGIDAGGYGICILSFMWQKNR